MFFFFFFKTDFDQTDEIQACVKWVKMVYPSQLGKGFIDEDDGDEDGKDLLGEAGDEPHQEAALKSHNDHHNDDKPHSDPYSPNNILNVLGLAELKGGMSMKSMTIKVCVWP